MSGIGPTHGVPPDRSGVATERRNARSMRLHAMSVPEIVRLINEEDRAVPEALARAGPALSALIEAAEPRFAAGGRLVYVGAGTSGRLGVLDAAEAPPTFQVEPGRIVGVIAGGDAALRQSSEGREDDRAGSHPALSALKLDQRDTVIGIAAGGTTPYVLGAIEFARACSAPPPLTALIVCSAPPAPEPVDHVVLLDTGPEVLTGSTRMKAGTATKLALNTLSTTLMVREGRVYENLMVDVRATNEKLLDRAARIVSTLTALPRPGSLELLARAGGAVKTAVVMHRLGVTRADAESRLAAVGGRLDRILDLPDRISEAAP
jgi:N-acetylmuramic acid 6-phosphate etherase